MNEGFYVIDQQLNARSLTGYLSNSGTWAEKASAASKFASCWIPVSVSTGIPITPDGELRPGVLYQSSDNPNVHFYLPSYRLQVANGRYTTSLKWRTDQDDPNGPLAFFTLILEAVPPQAPAVMPPQNTGIVPPHLTGMPSQNTGFISQEIPHEIAARIGYQMPLQDQRSEGVQAAATNDGSPTLWIEIGALQSIGGGIRSARLPISSKPDFDRLYQVLTDAKFKGVLELRSFATAGRRTYRQVVLANVVLATQAAAVSKTQTVYTASLNKQAMQRPAAPATPPRNVTLAGPQLAQMTKTNLRAPQAMDARMARPAPTAAVMSQRKAAPVAGPFMTAQRPAAATRGLSESTEPPQLGPRPMPAVRASDVQVRSPAGTVKAVPVRMIVDDQGQPALIRFNVETRHQISPFCFPIATNAYMFDLPQDMVPGGGHHILIRMDVHDGTGRVIGRVYQDSGYDDQFYYQPQEFRIPRLDTPPYLPDLRVLFVDLMTEEENAAEAEVTLTYKVRLAYRVVPHINPLLLELAQQQMPHVKARFNALVPQNTRLSLRVPEDETGGNLADRPRPEVDVRFDHGIVDEIELSRTEFERVFAFFKSPAGIGIEGEVEADLAGDVTRVPVRLSLKQSAGAILSHTYLGPAGNGMHRVRLFNRLESAVTIEALHRVSLGGGVFAFPQAVAGQTVAPGGELDLDYRVDPPASAVIEISPSLSTSVNSEPQLLWPRLFVNQGYTDDSFELQTSIDPQFFGRVPPNADAPLSAVVVEFDGGPTVMLNAENSQGIVSLYIPLLPRLLGDPQAKKYRYRVTNLLGPDQHKGSETDFIEEEGDAPLAVLPAGA